MISINCVPCPDGPPCVVDVPAEWEGARETDGHVLGLDMARHVGLLARPLAAHGAQPALGLAHLPEEAVRDEVIVGIMIGRIQSICKKRGEARGVL